MADARAVLDQAWRADAAGVLGVLARRLGDLDRAEEAPQDAVAEPAAAGLLALLELHEVRAGRSPPASSPVRIMT